MPKPRSRNPRSRNAARPPRDGTPRDGTPRRASSARSRPEQPRAAGRQPLGSPGSGGAAFGAGGYGAYAGEGQFGGAYGGRSADTAGPHRAALPQQGPSARQPREPYVERKRMEPDTPRGGNRARASRKGGSSYGGVASSGDYGYGARGEYGESQTGRDLPYGKEQSGRGGYTGYGTYGGRNEPAPTIAPRKRRTKRGGS